MFPGQGSQYTGMGRDLYRFEPVFREQVDLCSELLRPQLKIDLREVLYPGEQNAAEANRMLETCIAQPALFVVEYAIAKLWMAWGVHPDAMIGHSIGEYVAACLAGVFSLEDALALLAARGRLMQRLPGGAMLAVPMRPQEIRPLLGERLSLAAINESRLCVVSGPTHAVELLQSRLAEQGFPSRRLRISHAFQSRMMDPILEPFTDEVRRVKLKQPRILYLSNVTGTWITAAEATSSNYWARHLRHTVRFAEGVQELLKDPNRILLEVGPGQTLSGPAKRYRGKASGQVVFSSLRRLHDQGSESEFLLQTLGELWLAGKPVDWAGFSAHERRRRVPLPTYPFERQRYWIEPQKREHSLNTRPASHTQRQTLRAAGQGEAEPNETFVAPRNELESVIAQIWREVLGVDRLSVHDDFFKLGGHSLLATQIIARVRKALHVELPLRSLFDLSTVAELAATITEKASEKPLRIP
jgi:acyl transferase domain-containing protein